MSIAFSEIFLHRPAECANCVSGFALTGGSFSAPVDRGTRTAAGGFALTGGSFSCTAERGTRTAAGGFAPNGRLLFLHRLTGALELPQAGSPLMGGVFFAEPQRGIRRLRTAGTVPRPAAGAKRKGHLRFPFLFELLPFPCFLIWRRFPICDRFEKEYGSRVTAAYLSPPFRSSQTAYCYAYGLLYAGATYLCRANRFHVIPPSTYGF